MMNFDEKAASFEAKNRIKTEETNDLSSLYLVGAIAADADGICHIIA